LLSASEREAGLSASGTPKRLAARRFGTRHHRVHRRTGTRSAGAYRPALALALNSLGKLYRDTSRLAEADKAHSEALAISRDLAAHDPRYHTE
jgi:hypothetical protein